MRYVFLGDRLTRPGLAGRPCDPVRRPDGRVVRGRNRNALVVFDTGGHLLVGHGEELKRAVLGFMRRVRVEDDAGHEPGFAGQPSPE